MLVVFEGEQGGQCDKSRENKEDIEGVEVREVVGTQLCQALL